MEGTRRRMKAMGGGLSVSQGDDRWTTIFTIPLHPTTGAAPPAEAHRHSIAQ